VPRIAAIALAAVVLLLAGAQALIPRLAAGEAEDRLTADGGSADVSIQAFPAVRLLFGDGHRLKARGNGMRLDLEDERVSLEDLDGFDEVDVDLSGFQAGPMQVARFVLKRPSQDRPYRVSVDAAATPQELADQFGEQIGGSFGSFLARLGAGLLPDNPLPVTLDANVQTANGQIQVTGADASVAGIPAGPLAALIVSAVVQRL
jgi:hypothetical protein